MSRRVLWPIAAGTVLLVLTAILLALGYVLWATTSAALALVVGLMGLIELRSRRIYAKALENIRDILAKDGWGQSDQNKP